jgi:uncharacterized protein (TIGR01319 family)
VPAVALLVDFGSTFTKVVAVDLERPAILGRAQHPSTVDVDVTIGLDRAVAALPAAARGDVRLTMASSSARGGLRLVAVGLVPELTAEAARQAALGAGAKVLRVFSHQLTRDDVDALVALRPDLVLLAGGIDGGNREVIVHNAGMLAAAPLAAPVILGGNRNARDAVRALLERGGKHCYPSANVLPELDRLDVEPVRAVIRDAFVAQIVEAKGLDRAAARFDHPIVPTPAAVLDAARLLAEGTADAPGWGDLMVVDVGGATTDVHSVSRASPRGGLIPRGLPEPVVKRTVEGDLGVRVNAQSVVGLGERNELRADLAAALRGADARAQADFLAAHTDALPDTDGQRRLEVAMAGACVDIAVERHVGHVQQAWGSNGPVRLLHGKDLRDVRALIGVGGVFAAGTDPRAVLRAGLARDDLPDSMRPEAPTLHHDGGYVFYAMGLLARHDRSLAMRLLAGSLTAHPR